MKWQPIELHCEKMLEFTDQLGNACYDNVSEKKTFARISAWNEKDKSIIGREITVNDRKFVVRVPFKVFSINTKSIKAAGVVYEIFQVVDLGKFTLVYAGNQKGGANE